jgi:hypothetical protein
VNASALQNLLAQAVNSKPESHPFGTNFKINAKAMSEFGG